MRAEIGDPEPAPSDASDHRMRLGCWSVLACAGWRGPELTPNISKYDRPLGDVAGPYARLPLHPSCKVNGRILAAVGTPGGAGSPGVGAGALLLYADGMSP